MYLFSLSCRYHAMTTCESAVDLSRQHYDHQQHTSTHHQHVQSGQALIDLQSSASAPAGHHHLHSRYHRDPYHVSYKQRTIVEDDSSNGASVRDAIGGCDATTVADNGSATASQATTQKRSFQCSLCGKRFKVDTHSQRVLLFHGDTLRTNFIVSVIGYQLCALRNMRQTFCVVGTKFSNIVIQFNTASP